ncbi:MAG: cation:proton antiporter [Neisseriaceae bacterium]|nr:cation:proton antiporter [Neisseriaceae bacterium]
MHALDSVVLVLLVAVITVILCRRFRIPIMLGYLVVGFISGPGVLKLVPQTESTDFLGEIGIVFLMFSIGLEFSLATLRSMKRLVFGLGSLQVILTMLLVMTVSSLLGFPLLASFTLAGALAVSSTAIVSRLMSENNELGSPHGQIAMGILLMQDIAVVPIMILMRTLAGDASSLWVELPLALIKMVAVLLLLLYFGEKLLRPWFNLVAKQEQSELFMLNVLLVVLSVAYLTELAGLSLALGAFVAGMLIAETQYRFQVEDDIRPFRDILLGFFFITVGMKLDLHVLIQHYSTIIIFVLILLIIKALIIYGIAIWDKHSKKNSFQAALYLAQGGEFGFVLLSLALNDKLISPDLVQAGTASILISMLISPLIIGLTPKITKRLFKSNWEEQSVDLHHVLVENMSKNDHVILIGFGHTGQTVARLLQQENINYYVLDLNAKRVQAARLAGEPIAFGDAKRRDILMAAGLKRARMLILSSRSFKENEHILALVMSIRPTLPVIVRGNTHEQINQLSEKGASSIVSEDQEVGLVLASETMLNYGMPYHQVYKIIRSVRQNKYSAVREMFLGDDELAQAQNDKNLYRDSIQITQNAHFIGKPVTELPLQALRIGLIGIRRGSYSHKNTTENMVLQENDVLMVIGLPAEVEKLRQLILDGE